MGGKKAIFLDRDGVINEIIIRNGKLSVPYSLKEFKILPGVLEAINLFKKTGFLCVVVTNQPEIGSGDFSNEDLKSIHDFMKDTLSLDTVYFCPHNLDGRCDCRKPKPGMIRRAVEEFGIDLSKSFIIGDRWRDMEMGKAVGCRTILINSEATRLDNRIVNADFTADNLLEAAKLITK